MNQNFLDQYAQKLNELNAAGDPVAVEEYILNTLAVIDSPYVSCTPTCPSCRIQEKEDRESHAWLHSRVSTQVFLRSELISLYRATGRWNECLSVFDMIMENLAELNLLDTPLHGRILLNRALLHEQLKNYKEALSDAKMAQAFLEKAPEVDPDSLKSAIAMVETCTKALG